MNAQLELGLKQSPRKFRQGNRPQRRLRTSKFWFAQMRSVVANALDWEPTQETCEQSRLSLSIRRA